MKFSFIISIEANRVIEHICPPHLQRNETCRVSIVDEKEGRFLPRVTDELLSLMKLAIAVLYYC